MSHLFFYERRAIIIHNSLLALAGTGVGQLALKVRCPQGQQHHFGEGSQTALKVSPRPARLSAADLEGEVERC
jgi:hypothetical protein